MPSSFSKNIFGKNVTVTPATHSDGNKEKWGVRALCPWCAQAIQSTGYATAKKAANWWFDDLKNHYKRRHNKKP